MTELVSLKSLLVPSMETEIDFPGMEGFSVKVCHLGRESKTKLAKQATITKFDKRTHQPISELDDDKFLTLFAAATIKGWKGLKFSYLQELVPIDVSEQNLDDCLDFSNENAEILLQNSESFDSWIVEVVGDLENFTKSN